MIINIIGCGDSGKNWNGKGLSIGVNDMFKFGFHPTYLLVLDNPLKFRERLNTIKRTLAQKVFTNNVKNWSEYFSEIEGITTHTWKGRLKGQIYHSQTSPFPAIVMAYNFGAKNIILWGVDFLDHHYMSPGKPTFNSEMANYKSLFEALKLNGVNVFLGCNGSYFDNQLRVWDSAR